MARIVVCFVSLCIMHRIARVMCRTESACARAKYRRGCQRYPTSTSSGIARQEGLPALDQTANFSLDNCLDDIF